MGRHRYYGCHNASACPYTKADSEPLKWLSSRQALADLATFHSFATSQYGLTSPANKWVSFGGSYPGMLAGWFRVLYPSLVHASVSSSAPVVAKLDMTEYYDVASRAYSLPSVGGSYRCEQNIAGGHAAIGELMGTADGNAQLAVLFPDVAHEPAGWLNTTSGQRRFAGNGVISFPSQCARRGASRVLAAARVGRGGATTITLSISRDTGAAPSSPSHVTLHHLLSRALSISRGPRLSRLARARSK